MHSKEEEGLGHLWCLQPPLEQDIYGYEQAEQPLLASNNCYRQARRAFGQSMQPLGDAEFTRKFSYLSMLTINLKGLLSTPANKCISIP